MDSIYNVAPTSTQRHKISTLFFRDFLRYPPTICQDALVFLQLITVISSHVSPYRQPSHKRPIQISESPDRPNFRRWIHIVEVGDDECLFRAQSHVFVIECNESASSNMHSSFLCGTSGSLSADPTSQLQVFGEDGATLCMESTKVRVSKESCEITLCSFLESQDGLSLKANLGTKVLCNLSNQSLKRHPAEKKLGGLLVPPDLTESNSARTVTMLLLDCIHHDRLACYSGKRSRDLLSSSGLSVSSPGVLDSCMLGTCHEKIWEWL